MGLGHRRSGPPPHPDPARHDPQRLPTTTRSQPRNYPKPIDALHEPREVRGPVIGPR